MITSIIIAIAIFIVYIAIRELINYFKEIK